MQWDCGALVAVMAVLAGAGMARGCSGDDFGPGCDGYVASVVVVPGVPDGDKDPGPVHVARAWDIRCALPDGRALVKTAGNIASLTPLAFLQCRAAPESRPACNARQMAWGRE